MMLQRILQVHSHPQGEAIDGVRRNEALTNLAFLGRRRRVYARIVVLSGAKPGDRVLDVGCSGGYLARLLASAVGPAGSVTGIDPSSPAIAYARRRAPANCTFAIGVAQDLEVPDGWFDVVTSTLAVHHVPEAERPAALAEMHRVTRPGGRLLVADFRPSRLHPFGSPQMRHNKVELLEELASAAGFQVEGRGDLPLLRYVLAVRPDKA
jgi:ubiquinone/menaquinone biosynthesis C-methylase UbiE